MKNIIYLLPLLLLGCDNRSQTRAEWKSNHPYAKEQVAVPAHPQSPESVGVFVYTDSIPRVTATGAYSTEPRTYKLTVDQRDNLLAEVVE